VYYITRTVEHNYISPSSTVGKQLHVSAPYVGHLQGCDLTYRAAIQDVWGVWGGGAGDWVRGGRDLVVSIVGTMT